ncbi:MAG TPA: hypothetical protein VFK02_15560 [Kofleriaceae bacterium]|nr:hypothetical protein [Kofleriaceae bacterium]
MLLFAWRPGASWLRGNALATAPRLATTIVAFGAPYGLFATKPV